MKRHLSRPAVFRMFAIAIGILPIVLIEIGLRLLGIAADPTAAVPASLHANHMVE